MGMEGCKDSATFFSLADYCAGWLFLILIGGHSPLLAKGITFQVAAVMCESYMAHPTAPGASLDLQSLK